MPMGAHGWLVLAAVAAQDVLLEGTGGALLHVAPRVLSASPFLAQDAGLVVSKQGLIAPTLPPPSASGNVKRGMKIIQNAASLLLMFVVLAIAFVYKNLWFDFVYRATCGRIKCFSVRDVKCLGCFLANWMCPCFMGEWHPPVNMRVVVHQALHLRYASGMFGGLVSSNIKCYAIVTAGNNPTKTTSMQSTISESPIPVIFNEPLDLVCMPSTTSMNIEFRESDGDVIGDVDIRLLDVLSNVDFESRAFLMGDITKTEPMEFMLDYREKYAGTVICSFEVTHEDYPMPPVFETLDRELE